MRLVPLCWNLSSSIADPLTHIFTISMQTGVVPKYLKVAQVFPLLNLGIQDPLPTIVQYLYYLVFQNIWKKLVYKRMLSHVNQYCILYEHQYGFRKKYSRYGSFTTCRRNMYIHIWLDPVISLNLLNFYLVHWFKYWVWWIDPNWLMLVKKNVVMYDVAKGIH